MTKRKRVTRKKKPLPLLKLGDGMYADQDNPGITLLDPIEMLEAKGIEVTEAAAFSIYADAQILAKADGLELVLISHDKEPTTIEVVQAKLLEEDTPLTVDGKYDGPERRKFKRD